LLLRRHFHLSASDVYERLPVWEVDMLVAAVSPSAGDQTADSVAPALARNQPDPFGEALPDDLMML
jgi:hypothetical protein